MNFKVYRISIIVALVFVSSFLCYNIFQHLNSSLLNQQDAAAAVPMDAAVILESDNIQKVWSAVSETNLIWNQMLIDQDVNHFDQLLKKTDSLLSEFPLFSTLIQKQSTFISIHPSANTAEIFGVFNCETAQYNNIKTFLSSSFIFVDTLHFLNNEVLKFRSNDSTIFYGAYFSPFAVFSSSEALIKQSFSQLSSTNNLLANETFNQLRQSASPSSNLHVYCQKKQLNKLLAFSFNESLADELISKQGVLDWVELDLLLKPNSIMFSGMSLLAADSSRLEKSFFQDPIIKHSQDVLPSDIDELQRNSISNLGLAQVNDSDAVLKLNQVCNCDAFGSLNKVLGNQLIDLTFIDNFNAKHRAVLLEEIGHVNAEDLLKELAVVDSSFSLGNYSAFRIGDLSFANALGLTGFSEQQFFVLANNHVVISTIKGIHALIQQWSIREIKKEASLYDRFSSQFLSDYMTKEIYFSKEKAAKYFHASSKNESKEYRLVFELFNALDAAALQTAKIDNLTHHHSMVVSTGQASEEEAKYLWAIDLDSIAIAPQILKNHRTNTAEVLVQDFSNTIHLVSATGRVKWSKKIDGQIMGAVQQIDIYNNGKWQMLFNTANELYVLDINGEAVFSNPVKFESPATNSVAIIDYDRNSDYRFLVSCENKKTYNYNKEGKKVNGWKPFSTKSLVRNAVYYFSIANKDYLLLNDENAAVYLLNRRGEERFKASVSADLGQRNGFSVVKGSDIATSKIVFIDTLNVVNIKSLNGENSEQFTLDSSKVNAARLVDFSKNNIIEYVQLSSDKLALYGPDKTLGGYESLSFSAADFSILGKEKQKFVLVENQSLNQVYLYNSNLVPVENFPVLGSSKSAIGDLNKDGHLEFVSVINGKLIAYTISSLAH